MELRVIRQQGQLLNQLVRYTVTPSGNEDFYGATGILEFQPGEREVVVALVAIPDGLPEVGIVSGLVVPKLFWSFRSQMISPPLLGVYGMISIQSLMKHLHFLLISWMRCLQWFSAVTALQLVA